MPTTGVTAKVHTVPEAEFLCEYSAHCSAQCRCCDFYACDCRFQVGKIISNTVLIGYYDYLGTRLTNSHRPIIVTRR